MKEELKNLTPEMVEKLRSLGVEFEDTQMLWLHQEGEGWFSQPTPNDLMLTSIFAEKIRIDKTLSAPDLSEVLKKLPKYIICPSNRTINMPLSLSWCDVTERWYIGYEHAGVDAGFLFSHESNPLVTAYELLKWIAIDYPESSKGGHIDE